jgi:integral membrane protein (TIGR01906 family)
MKPVLSPWLRMLCRVALVVFIPVVLTLTNVRLLMTPLFPEIEYRLPGFPDDFYGFTRDNRLQGAKVAIDYLVNQAGIDFLAKLTFADVGLPGASTPDDSCAQSKDCSRWAASVGLAPASQRPCTYFYNTCELKHMQDVKNVVQVALSIWLVGGVLALLAAGVLFYNWEWSVLRASLLAGAGLTMVIYLGLLTYIALNFNALFVQFHEVFFASGTWTFLWSDSLIRMFPLRFWQDCFIFVSAASVLEAAGLGALSRVIK